MDRFDIYQQIAERTNGDIYIGVVGPVRTGKSTFIKRFMDLLVIPNITDTFERDRAIDELPQSASGKTIMTTEPKFIPNEAANITIDGNIKLKVRLVDCVGYLVEGALGHLENDVPRMVDTPWFEEKIPFGEAAEIGTKKVITEHSTIGLVVTTDGSITDIARSEYEEAEERVITEMKNAVQNLTGFANSLIPLMITLMITTGNVVSSGMLQPILLLLVTFISNFMTNILIPIALVATALGIISKISDQAQVGKLSKFLNSSMVWILGTVLTLFVSVTSLEGGLTSSIDGVTAKAAKTAISSVVPVVGSILGDAVNTIMGCSNIIKNAVGVVGIIVIIAICIRPIVQLAALTITYYLGAALCEPIADDKIVGIMEQMGGTFKIFLAVLFALTVLLIIGIAIVMKISNSGLMYG